MFSSQSARRGSPVREAALAQLAAGRSVVPCCWPRRGQAVGCLPHGPRCPRPGKRPLIDWVAYQTRHPTAAEVTGWWEEWPRANVALVLGTISGVVALDCDDPAGEAAVQEAGPLPATWRVATGRAGSCHLLFAHGTRLLMVPSLFPAVGFRAEGTVSILPPSRHWMGRRYRWTTPPTATRLAPLPTWLVERALTRVPERPGEELAAEVATDAVLARQAWGFRPTLGAALGCREASASELLALLRRRVDRMAAGDERTAPAE